MPKLLARISLLETFVAKGEKQYAITLSRLDSVEKQLFAAVEAGMSTQFRPLEIPPGVVAKATKQQRSSNWAEVHLMRWVEGQMAPVGGQSQYQFTFASRCKRVHGWFGPGSIYHIAYLCEAHLYVDTGGILTDITPVGGIQPPTPVGEGGYGDSFYSDDEYGTPRAVSSVAAQDKVPSAYSSIISGRFSTR